MKRLLLMIAALATLAGPLAAAGGAMAQGRHNGGGPSERGWERGRGHGPPQRWAPRPQGRDYPPQGRGYYPPQSRGYYPPAGRAYPPAGYGVRRGGYLPPAYQGRMVDDYGRYRLRPPPPGYAWYRVGDDYILVSLMNGLIFDVIRP